MDPTVVIEGLSKRFGAVEALKEVSLEAFSGEVHAVIGENGAGKSTLMQILGGFAHPDSGQVRVLGRKLDLGSPTASAQAGIAMVHQHFMLVPEFTVEENLALARAADGGFLLSAADAAGEALEIGRELGWTFEPELRVRQLSVGLQQRLEILKALSSRASVLIFDEPTAVLMRSEAEDLFRVLRRLKDEGKTVLLIAHKLSEVLEVADRVTVLRKGRLVASAPRAEVNAAILAEWMLGEAHQPEMTTPISQGEILLRVENLQVRGDRGEARVRGARLEARAGEVLGIGGVEGNGQIELAEALAGIRQADSGTIVAEGSVAYIPGDRHREGLALDMPIEDNLLIEGHRKPILRRGPFLLASRVRAWANRLREAFDIVAPDVEVPARSLSGGNQQKVIVARTLDAKPSLLVAVNPTRGLDLRASSFVRHLIRQAAADGAAVVLFSSDADELAEVSSRMQYMAEGRLAEAPLGGIL